MSLNIKNERTHALVRELATLRGVNQTDAVTEAVERRIAELKRETEDELEARIQHILGLAAQMAPGFRDAWGDKDPTDELYDEFGAPK